VQLAEDPLQISRVQIFPSSEHGVFAGRNGFAGQVSEEPLHTAARSHSPMAARQTEFAGFGPNPHLPAIQVATAHGWDAGGVGQVSAVVQFATQDPF